MMAALDDIESRMPEPLPAIWGIADERKSIPQIHILDRGMHSSKGNRVGPRVPGLFLPDNSPEYEDDNHSEQHRTTFGLGALADESRKSLDRQGDGKSSLALPFWTRHCGDSQRFWSARGTPNTPGVARLACN